MAQRPSPYTFTVEGRGEFPFDMLRYDLCWPYTIDDAYSLGHHSRDLRRIVIESASSSPPTATRWASFNWRVVGFGVQRSEAA